MEAPAPQWRKSPQSALTKDSEVGECGRDDALASTGDSKFNTTDDSWNMALLVLLYAMQGVPLGLSLGSLPFILKTKSTYTDIGIFSLAAYPYSLKLLWSPIVDTVFSPRIGWRKSWILPIQLCSGLLMLTSAGSAQRWLDDANIEAITSLFFIFILLAATQDIAVDGWALTLLSRKNVGHASTCQTVGMNMGYFMSFTIFLALSDPSFCNRYLRHPDFPSNGGIITLASYFRFWGAVYLIVTFGLLFKSEAHHYPSPRPSSPTVNAGSCSQPTPLFTPVLHPTLSSRRSSLWPRSEFPSPSTLGPAGWDHDPPSADSQGSGRVRASNEMPAGADVSGIQRSSSRVDLGAGDKWVGEGRENPVRGTGEEGAVGVPYAYTVGAEQAIERILWGGTSLNKRIWGGSGEEGEPSPQSASASRGSDQLLPVGLEGEATAITIPAEGFQEGGGGVGMRTGGGVWRREGGWNGAVEESLPLLMRQVRSSQGSGVGAMYARLWSVMTLPRIRALSVILLLSKLGTVTAEAVGVFKLMEKGVPREIISLIVLIEFPLELFFAVFAGRWASHGRPFTPWLVGYSIRLAMAATSTLLVALFPTGASTIASAPGFYLAIVLVGIVTSFSSTLMFVSQGTFFARVSDSSMGGTYLTLLNTISNMGSSWPKFFVFFLIDLLTFQRCIESADPSEGRGQLSCVAMKHSGDPSPCVAAGGRCLKVVDGFYLLSTVLVAVGILFGVAYRSTLQELESAKEDAWRA